MYALVDCNSFFCSVERVFHPGLRNRPVCVLSSNDGIIVALTAEAKAAGLKRGDPIFKVRDIVERNGVSVFSGNLFLYSAMSKRIVSILRDSVAHIDNYSIDESFCDLNGYEKYYDLTEYMRAVADKIKLWTDIPVSVGIAPTKTLAKIASKYAKKYPGYRSVCMMDTEEKRRKALAGFDLSDVWGIGCSGYQKLVRLGVQTPLEFADRSEGWVRSHFTKPGVQTWMELNGKPCISTEESLCRQSIRTCRTFSQMITSFEQLKAPVTSFACSCANKLRAQGSVAGRITVFATSNPHRDDLKQYWGVETAALRVATADTIELVQEAIRLLEKVYQDGVCFKRAGVLLDDIRPSSAVELDLFDPIVNRSERLDLSRAIDRINGRYGLKSVRFAVETGDNLWSIKCEHRSPNYLTDLDELLTVRV